MKKMTSINIDKWRTLNEDLFKGYVLTYDRLSKDSELDPADTLVDVFESLNIKLGLTSDGYGSAYTIAREIGIYYEDDEKFILSKMAKAYLENKLTYSDYLKYYCLNVEFLINDIVVHPFKEIVETLRFQNLDKNEIAERAVKLVPESSPASAVDCLRLFLNRCVEASLLKSEDYKYSLNHNYSILLDSINISDYSAIEFENLFIRGNQSVAQKNYVTLLLEREVSNLFEGSFTIDKKNKDVVTEVKHEDYEVNMLDSFANWFAIPTERHNYMNNNFSNSISRLKESLLEYERVYESEFGSKIFTFNKNNKDAFIADLESNLEEKEGSFFELSKKTSNHLPRAILGKNNYLTFLKKEYSDDSIIPPKEVKPQAVDIRQEDFNLSNFKSACDNAGLIYSEQLLTRFTASLATKPFVLLTGLSGSGKTKLAQAFAQWICESKDQYCIVPVGADWINREPLLGYVNALDNREYVLPENGALELIIRANNDKKKPYFLVLDEMNLSHVERYFADFLSVMESKDKIKLHSAKNNLNNNEEEGLEDAIEVPKDLSWPENLFVVGTVNIDETTYMFSPKVLDRANVIEFRISAEELGDYFEANNNQLDMKKLCEADTNVGKGAKYGESFVTIAKSNEATKDVAELNDELKKFFEKLQEIGAEFGYRSASEIQVLFKKLDDIDISYSSRTKEKIDIAIMQKLLPKLHGSRSKLVDVLFVLASFCYDKEFSDEELKEIFKKSDTNFTKIKYPISLEKINRMYRNVIDNGFTSYAEA